MKKTSFILLIVVLSLLSCKLFQSESENSKPVASFVITPNSGTVETVYSFDANGCTDKEDDTSELQVRWDWECDSNWDTDWSKEKTATHQYDVFADYEIRIEVKDSEGLTDEMCKSISMTNTPPTALFTITPTGGVTSTTFTFDASGCVDKEDDTSNLAVRWDWNNDGDWDDDFNSTKIITHQFNTVKTHTIIMEVKDTHGLSDTLSTMLDVSVGDGAIIIDDIILTEDINCTAFDQEAIKIGASSVTVDLGGFTIKNQSQNREKIGLEIPNVDNVTIKNGTIEGFLFGIDVRNSNNITIENVNINNMNITHADTFVFGISTSQCYDIDIRDSQFEFPTEAHKTAIVSYESIINVDNIELQGGSVGVNFSYANSCEPGSQNCNNGGIVSNSKFTDSVIAGVLVACSNNALIQNNEFIRNEIGFQIYGPHLESVTNLIIKDNYIHDGFQGVVFMGVTESTIDNNIIENVWRGIMMDEDHECLVGNTSENCFYSTGNMISNNILTGNVVDLEHHPLAIGNTWINNSCGTKEGSEIPDCTN